MIERFVNVDGTVTYHTNGELGRANGPMMIATNGGWWWGIRGGYAHRYYGPQNWRGVWMLNGIYIKND